MQRSSVPTLLGITIAAVTVSLLALPGPRLSHAAPDAQGQCSAGAGQASFPFVPDTVSTEWQERLRRMPDPSCAPAYPAIDDLESWQKLQQARENGRMPLADAAVARYQPTVETTQIGGVPVLDVKPKEWRDNGKVLVYAHGGGFVLFSRRSSLNAVVPLADLTGLRIISVDYTLAPVGRWEQVTDQAVAVFQGLVGAGYRPQDIGVYGDSAGGNLVAAATLKLRDRGLGMPGAVVLWSPVTDLTDRGDTFTTLAHADPVVYYSTQVKVANAAYADPSDQRNPYVSPVYGDFSKGYPPTLIQGGTKEVLLSGFVRLYRALDTAGVPATLDLYEGMPHVFQHMLADAPEAKLALDKTRAFLDAHLGH